MCYGFQMDKLLELKDLKNLVEKNQFEHPELNTAIIVAAAIWGLKAGELSSIEVGDLVTAKGQLKKKWLLRAEVAFNGQAREIYSEHESLVKYLISYFQFRSIHEQGTTNLGEYYGLDPDSKVFLTPDGEPFKFFRGKSENKVKLVPVGMNNYFKKLILTAGMYGHTYKDFRRSLAIQMYREGLQKTGVIKDIMRYLGIRSYSAIRKILNSDPKALHDMIKGIHTRI